MTQEEFEFAIEYATGKTMTKGDYGLILGTFAPFTPERGFMSATIKNGFEVFKKIGEGYETLYIDSKEGMMDKILKFLK